MRKILFLLLVGIITSCTLNPQKRAEKKMNRWAQEVLSRKNYIIPDSLFSFFLNNVEQYDFLKIGMISDNIIKADGETENSPWWFFCTKLIEVYVSDSAELLQPFIDTYRSVALSSVKSEDNNYFVIASESDLSREYSTTQLKEKYSMAKNEPLVPYFKEPFIDLSFLCDTTTICGLPIGYEILILKQGNEIVLPKSRLYEWSILPKEIRHGYRSGVAFKEGEPYIIYWTISW